MKIATKNRKTFQQKLQKSKNRLFRFAIFPFKNCPCSSQKCFEDSSLAPRAKKKKVNALKMYGKPDFLLS